MIRTSLLLPLALLPLVGCAPADSTAEQADGLEMSAAGDVIDGEFVISEDLSQDEMDELGLQQIAYDDVIGGLYYAEDGVTVDALQRALQQHGRTPAFVEQNRPVHMASVNDPYATYQWDMSKMDVQTAWSYATGKGVTVAVVDTGLYKKGEDTPVHLATGYDFVDGDTDPTDENGHGTHVSGTIAQATNNGVGCIGVAPDATILPVRVLGADGSGDAYTIAQGIKWAADNGAQVINMSLGSAYSSSTEKSAIDYAAKKGVVIVAASGNDGSSTVGYPAAYSNVIAVGASRYDGKVTSYSNYGSALDIVAPGGDMSVDQNKDGYGDGILQETIDGSSTSYQFFEGTSMASPHVAGVAALLLSAGAKPADVAGYITSTAKDIGTTGWDKNSGYGLVQPVAALQKLASGGSATTPSSGGGSTTTPSTSDTTPPAISGVGGSRSGTSLTIWWKTDEPSTTYVDFDGYGEYGDATLVTSHSIKFTIDSSATYDFTVVSSDASGNKATNGVWETKP